MEAERTFEGSPGTIEEGLDVDDAELVQLRRACRLLEVGSNLLDQGYYTVVIESAFVAIERTVQFRLIHDGAMSDTEVIRCKIPFNNGNQANRTKLGQGFEPRKSRLQVECMNRPCSPGADGDTRSSYECVSFSASLTPGGGHSVPSFSSPASVPETAVCSADSDFVSSTR